MPFAVVMPFAVAVIMIMDVAMIVTVVMPVRVLVAGAGFSATFAHFARLLLWMHSDKFNSADGYCQRVESLRGCPMAHDVANIKAWPLID